MTNQPLKKLPLESFHQQAEAKFCSFAGWSMPISYPLGILKEHLHVRQHAGLFDISHMKLILVEGNNVTNFLDYSLPLNSEQLSINHSQYNFLLNEQAGIIDDLIITRLAEQKYIIAVNAGNAYKDLEILKLRNSNYNCNITMLDYVFLALQGPESAAVCNDLGLTFVNDLLFMQACETNNGWFVSRSGYTGEDGFEFALPLTEAEKLVNDLLKDTRVQWIGLGARDSLRLEAGLCLHGNDITENITPLEANLMWAIPPIVREKAAFIGASALNEQLKTGSEYKRVGLKVLGKQPLRSGVKLFSTDGNEVGYITSGSFGPSVNYPIAMGYVKNEYKTIDTELTASVRGKNYNLIIKKLPFSPQRYHKG
ncbi:glycine cleavage system aminomethyltransferase GcvT [Bartonella sp. DGB1]|uniref:glycine cleavage system aminomethyltransferase GcvT n=1 Tax=Bartonella sp. DGB1 TaxID=3239807 RepID=UPI003523ACAB